MNKNGQVLVDNNLFLTDSVNKLDSLIPYFYLHSEYPLYEYPKSSLIALLWDREVGVYNLSYLIFDIVNGYLKTVSEYSETRFNKKLCNLSNKELELIKDSLSFELEFYNHGIAKPPPELEITEKELYK